MIKTAPSLGPKGIARGAEGPRERHGPEGSEQTPYRRRSRLVEIDAGEVVEFSPKQKQMESRPRHLDFEEVSKNVFDAYLRSCPTPRRLEWKRYPNGKSAPPDYNLIIGDKVLAVEVTVMTTVRQDGKFRISDRTYQVSRLELANDLTEKALKLGILKGRYIVHFNMDWLVPLKTIRRQLETRIFDFVRKSKDQEEKTRVVLKYKNRTVCEISKLDDHQSFRICATFTDAQWSDAPEVQLGKRDMVQSAVTSKATKLRNGNIPQPWALLLCNTNPFASETDFRKCENLGEIKGKELFDWIFIVTSTDSGFVFYRKEQSAVEV